MLVLVREERVKFEREDEGFKSIAQTCSGDDDSDALGVLDDDAECGVRVAGDCS